MNPRLIKLRPRGILIVFPPQASG